MDGKCQVCGKNSDNLIVAASTCGAMSFAYCPECLESGAEPYGELVLYVSLAGSKPEDINDMYKEIIDCTLKRLNIQKEKFWADVKKNAEEW